jgi:hypothetical protein
VAAGEVNPDLFVAYKAPLPDGFVFGTGYSDSHLPPTQRDFTQAAFNKWRTDTFLQAVNISFAQWRDMKKAEQKALDAQTKKAAGAKKKPSKVVDVQKTTENHLERLKAMDPSVFAVLNNKWASNYGFDGKFSLAQLKKDGIPKGTVGS